MSPKDPLPIFRQSLYFEPTINSPGRTETTGLFDPIFNYFLCVNSEKIVKLKVLEKKLKKLEK